MIRPGSIVDELTAPLGQSPAPQRQSSIARPIAVGLGILLLAGGGLGFVAFKGLWRDQQTAAAPAAPAAPPQPIQVQAPAAAAPADPNPTGAVRDMPGDAARRTVTIIDGMSGKRQEVVIGAPEPAPSAAAGPRSH
jgi:hypothetical protein